MIRVLHVIGKMGCGGAEKIIMCLYRNIDRTKIQFDFVVHTEDKAFYDDEIEELGGSIYRAPKFVGTNIIAYRNWWKDFFKINSQFNIVHGHIGSCASIYLHEAKKNNIYTIAHSHATTDYTDGIKSYIWRLFAYPTRYIADYFMACSIEAGKDRFGNKVYSKNFSLLKNAIDGTQFIYSGDNRNKVREKYGIKEDDFVIGHIGRMAKEKNHFFILNLFSKLLEYKPKSKLLLVGDGPLRNAIKNKCIELGIEDKVIFAGIQKNTEDFYCAMDVFVFPSFFEGVGIVAIEAQATGLNVIASDNVPNEADIGADLFVKIPLRIELWLKKILSLNNVEDRKSQINCLERSGYEIKRVTNEIQKFDLEKGKNDEWVC